MIFQVVIDDDVFARFEEECEMCDTKPAEVIAKRLSLMFYDRRVVVKMNDKLFSSRK